MSDAALDLLAGLEEQQSTTGFRDSAETVGRTWGKVVAASPCTVLFAGDTAATRIKACLGSYTPVANDVVGLVKFGSEWWIVGKRTSV